MKCCDFQKIKCPVMKKCCFCVPIRKGVIIFGYVNLVISLLSVPFLLFLVVDGITSARETEDEQKPPEHVLHIPLTIAFVAIDVIITIVLLIGAHKKKRTLLQIYFYFGTLFQILTLCVDLIYFDFREYMENTVYFIFFGLNIYLLFLVYSTIQVMKENREVQYVTYRER
ncbi:uncharacterized protein LOC120631570 [Pararge aegeria]|uniref:uncharacterized protein LOC120631570 n=1 Tax=Pararge aegeria TaxID=116150 RepID=UPI0019D21E89|nr:uncharacterized protein LOC120631570 [Pararge aegeria]